jgi:RHS repeat-associated protein
VSERLPLSNKSLWYHFGPQGETRQLTNAAGAVVDTYTYTAYGQTVASMGTDVNPFQYGGQVGYYLEPDAPNDGYLCGYRWYNPSSGTFTSRDPIGYSGGSNLYRYCVDNPVRGIDPDGEKWQIKFPTIRIDGFKHWWGVGTGAAGALFAGLAADNLWTKYQETKIRADEYANIQGMIDSYNATHDDNDACQAKVDLENQIQAVANAVKRRALGNAAGLGGSVEQTIYTTVTR